MEIAELAWDTCIGFWHLLKCYETILSVYL